MNRRTFIALVAFNAPAVMADLNRLGLRPEDLPREHEMQAIVDEVLAMTGLHNDVRVVIDPSTTGCAYATTAKNGQQYIGVDPGCVGPLRTNGVYNWRSIGALTHEIGHLLSGHTTNQVHSHREELEADEWAGWSMARLGATLEEARTIFRTFSVNPSTTHPGRAQRLEAVALGWTRGGGKQTTEPSTPAPPKPEGDGWLDLLNKKLPWATDQ